MTVSEPSSPWLRRVQALLAKAESTDFPEEAEAFLAKAQELMSRHAIDEALLSRSSRSAPARIVSRSMVIEPPYSSARSSLLAAVARANDCRMVVRKPVRGRTACTLVGHASDVERAMVLFTSLSLHATAAMLRAPSQTGRPRAFRHAFLLAYAARIGERLREARDLARLSAAAAAGDGTLAIVLSDRGAAVDDAFKKEFPLVTPVRQTASSGEGIRGGTRSADAAGLGGPVLGGARELANPR
jgi:hypothetical protein